MKKRQLSDKFMNDLLTGCLNPLLKEVQEDDTLCLELRGNFDDPYQKGEAINIYYRGGSLFKVTRVGNNYNIFFDMKYASGQTVGLSGNPSVGQAVSEIASYKRLMDKWFKKHLKMERELQQFIVRENNNTNISNSTDYFIIDIEYAISDKGSSTEDYLEDLNGRFDMVAFKWLSTERTSKKNISLALIELKYGDGSYGGTSGIQKHLDDFHTFFSNKKMLADFCDDMAKVFKQKCILGIVKEFTPAKGEIKINSDNPEAIFIFANHNPKSDALKNVLAGIFSQNYPFRINVAQASMMGTCLHDKKMIEFNNFKTMVNNGQA